MRFTIDLPDSLVIGWPSLCVFSSTPESSSMTVTALWHLPNDPTTNCAKTLRLIGGRR